MGFLGISQVGTRGLDLAAHFRSKQLQQRHLPAVEVRKPMAKTWRCWDRKNHENSWLPQEIWWFVPRNLMVFLRTFDGFSHENSWFSQENWCFLSAQKILGTLMVSKGNHPQMMCGWFVSAMFTLVNYYKIQPDLMVFPRKISLTGHKIEQTL